MQSNVSDDQDWVLVLGDIEEPVGMTTIYRKISIDSDIDQYRWYAVTTTDKWGNQNLAISSPGNIWRVHEDTTAPAAEISVEGEDDCHISMRFKSKDGRTSLDMSKQLKKIVKLVI